MIINKSPERISTGTILNILSSQTRCKILSILAEEPMYFNQLARKVRVGQQAILRHMNALEKSGIIESYEEKSTLGGPNRKYYRIRTSFNMSISLSKDSFSIINREIAEAKQKNKDTAKRYKDLELLPVSAGSLTHLKQSLLDVENQIRQLEERINDLHALKQKILSNIHSIFPNDKFDSLERDIVYTVMKNSPGNLEDLSDMVDKSMKDTNAAISSLYGKLGSADAKRFLRK